MSKQRIHELAKELNKDSKDIIDVLKGKGVEVKTSMNSLDESQIAMVKKHYAPAAPAEKKKVARVFNPQNSKKGNNAGMQRQVSGQKPAQKPTPAQKPVQKPAETTQAAVKPVETVTVTSKPAETKPVETKPVERKTASATEEHRPYNNNNGERRPYNNNNGERRPYNNNNGERRPYNNNNGERRPYNNNNGERRPYNNNNGDRPYNNNNGERRPYNNNNGERRPYNNNNGERRPYNNNNGERPYNNNNGERRPYNNNNGDRPYNNNNGERRPYNNNNGERRPYNNNNGDRPYNNNNGERRPYNNNNGDRPYNNNNGERRPYNNNNGERRPYNNNNGDRPYNNNNGERRPYNNNGDRPYNNDRRDGGRREERKTTEPILAEQKPTRAKAIKNDHKKKDYNKNNNGDGKGPKNIKGKKPIAPIQRPVKKVEPKVEEKIKMITIPETLTIGELAEKMKIVSSTIIKKLFLEGKVVTVNHELDYEAAEEIALGYEILCEKEVVVDVIEELLKEEEENEDDMVKRPPVVCVMGHVDHGKTSLLDAIRKTNVTDREAGGITQHIGAHVTEINGEKITFLDTPGHEAFTAMRMRGANSTDIAILVVAADDGVMPQTVEAINHARAAETEIIVAINKMDKPSANIERVKQELSEHQLISEDWGGSTIFVPVSAKTGEGIEDLLEMILLTAEVLELKANPNRQARGLVIEAELDKGKGSVATVLVQKGTLRVGDNIAAGSAFGRVRAMMDSKGQRITEATPSIPVEILGLNDVPNAGEVFVSCESDKESRAFADTFISQNRVKMLEQTKSKSVSLDDLFSQIQDGNLKDLPIIVKADVQGSVEAMKQSLLKLSNDEVVVKVIHGGVGAINESDVILASASKAIIIGFNVRPDSAAKETADREGVDVRLYSVIYNAIEDVEAAMKGMLDPVFEEKVLGHAEVRQTFKASGIGTIAGSYVLDGTFERGCSVRVTREGELIFEGPLASLKRFKDDVKEVRAGYECGFVFEKFNDVKEEDQVEAYKMVEVPR